MIEKLALIAVALLFLLTPSIDCAPAEPETIKIGCVLSTTGLLGPKGKDRLEAARLAVEEINADGGVLSTLVKLLEADDATDPDRCLEKVKKMVQADGVTVLVGGMSSGAVMACGPYLAEQKVLMVSPSATSTDISDQPWTNWVFRTTPRDAFQGRILAKVIMEEGFTRLATMVQANPYGVSLEEVLIEALKKAGWNGNHVISIHFDPAKEDYRTQLQSIKDSEPDVVLAVTYIEDGIIIFKQALEMGLDEIAWLGCDGNYSDHMFRDPKCAEFMEKAILAGTRSVPPSGETYDKFAAAYKAATGKDPSVYCDTTYDAVKMIAKAIEKAGIYDGEAIKDALFEVGQKYRGASGIITFNDKGDRVSGIYEIWKVVKDPTTETGYKNVRIEVISIG
ncbi:MAG TPA: ABC transporter substrate-binding protein [Dehalococcoidia bacterium]|nr:ABC transporter substrate-binding protein [Dehalococcoidia bacterium]